MPSGAKKGFFGRRIDYWRLSYRGRFLYDLLMTPVAAAFFRWRYRPSGLSGYWYVGVLILFGMVSAACN